MTAAGVRSGFGAVYAADGGALLRHDGYLQVVASPEAEARTQRVLAAEQLAWYVNRSSMERFDTEELHQRM